MCSTSSPCGRFGASRIIGTIDPERSCVGSGLLRSHAVPNAGHIRQDADQMLVQAHLFGVRGFGKRPVKAARNAERDPATVVIHRYVRGGHGLAAFVQDLRGGLDGVDRQGVGLLGGIGVLGGVGQLADSRFVDRFALDDGLPDGDVVGVCVSHLRSPGIYESEPSRTWKPRLWRTATSSLQRMLRLRRSRSAIASPTALPGIVTPYVVSPVYTVRQRPQVAGCAGS